MIIQKHVDQLRYMPLIDDIYKENDKNELKNQIEINEKDNNTNETELEQNENELNPIEPLTQEPLFVDNENEKLTNTPVTNQSVSPVINERPKRNRRPPKYLDDYET